MQSSTVAACGLALLCVLAGCSGDSGTPTYTDPPVDDRVETDAITATDTATPFGPSVNETDQPRSFLDVIRGRNLGVESVQTRNGSVHVRYEAVNGSERREQAAFFLGLAYGSAVNDTWSSAETWNASAMAAVAVDENGTPVTSFRMPAYWGRQTATGAIEATDLAARIRNATANRTDEGGETGTDAMRVSFRDALATDADATVADFDERGETAFLTLETETSDDALAATLATLTETYGQQANGGWNASVLEVTIRGTDGDLYGWYRVEADAAVDTDGGSVPGGVLDRVYRENGALEPAQ
ncbi:hypothetical protein ACFR9U_17855 [Halorientalis brevis]|uniref:DUF8159 domain-containing protein n=1 Tax=Halorientalis brevis TaxID=1126241 RepID=A0ABD6CFN4_9EURY|nr:hypothetical protein [Halorientalis brevis]